MEVFAIESKSVGSPCVDSNSWIIAPIDGTSTLGGMAPPLFVRNEVSPI